MKYEDGSETKRAKGVRRPTVKQSIHHIDYKKAYEEQRIFSFDQMRIRSNLHHMETIVYNKKSLSFFEDKRCWLSLNESLPYGHYSLPQDIKSRPQAREVEDVPLHLIYEEVDNSFPLPDNQDVVLPDASLPHPKRPRLL